MTYYYDIMSNMLEMAWVTLICLPVQGDEHFSRGQAVRFLNSDPAHCHEWGGAHMSAVAHLIPPSVLNTEP